MPLPERLVPRWLMPCDDAAPSTDKIIGIMYAVLSLFYVSLCMHLPVSLYVNASADDGLFFDNAISLVKLQWLGQYSQMTLVKGPTFPFFLALNALLGVPVTLSIALVYLFSCLVLIRALRSLGVGGCLALLIFAVMLFHPQLFPARIIRDNIYPALTLLVMAGALRILGYREDSTSIASLVPHGLALGLFWLTREEGVWIVPSLLLVIAVQGLRTYKEHKTVARFARCLCVAVLAAYLPVFAVSAANMLAYGRFEAVDINGPAFSGAIKSLYSVQTTDEAPYLPVSAAKRKLLYQVSPAFRELEDYFEVAGKGWTIHGCEQYPQTCGDYATGWFMWALRDAVASRGHYDTPAHAAQFYRRLSAEIEAARERGDIRCRANPIPLMPWALPSQFAAIPQAAVRLARLALAQNAVRLEGDPSTGPQARLQQVRLFLGNPRTPLAASELTISLSGWYHARDGGWISLRRAAGGPGETRPIKRLDSPDVAKHLGQLGANRQRFSLTVTGADGYRITADSTPQGGIEINALPGSKQLRFDLGEGRVLHFDGIPSGDNAAAYTIPFALKGFLASGYRLLMPLMVCLGLLGYAWGGLQLLRRTGRPGTLFACATALWLAVAARGGLLILVDISSFPAIKGQYFAPAFPLLCAAALVSCSLFRNSGLGAKKAV